MRYITSVLVLLSATVLVGYARAPGWAESASPCAENTCTGDRNGDGVVTIDEILTAVNNALNGCPAEQIVSVAGTWTWTETQTEVLNANCSEIGKVKTYAVTIDQQGHQVTFVPGSDVVSGSVNGSIEGTVVSAAGTVELQAGYIVHFTISLFASADGRKLTGTLVQSSSDACTGSFWVSATKAP